MTPNRLVSIWRGRATAARNMHTGDDLGIAMNHTIAEVYAIAAKELQEIIKTNRTKRKKLIH